MTLFNIIIHELNDSLLKQNGVLELLLYPWEQK